MPLEKLCCPTCNANKQVIKAGLRHTKKGIIQKFYCKHCKAYFNSAKQSYTHYPQHIILYSLHLYNQGYPVSQVKTLTGKRYPFSPPTRTIYFWIKQYQTVASFLKIRKRYQLDPGNLISTETYHHQQIYPFRYHHLKLNIASKQLPQLKRYINWITRNLNTELFLSGPRASNQKQSQQLRAIKKDSILTTQAKFALSDPDKRLSAHEKVQRFLLINDLSTICTELPVFLYPKETRFFHIDEPLTGHIDIIQIKQDEIHILDYKPNLRKPEQYSGQLLAYKEAIYQRTHIPRLKIKTAVFNQYDYFELQ